MQMTDFERLVLVNQFLLLEKLYPEQAKPYSEVRQALESGFELFYSDAFEPLYKSFPAAQCEEVVDILNMHRMMRLALSDLGTVTGVTEDMIHLRGFDGNEEASQWRFAKYLFKIGRFPEVVHPDGLNSHCGMMATYRDMLAAYRQCADKYKLTADDVRRILKAAGRL